jgi:uncharacterized membrane protein YhhN
MAMLIPLIAIGAFVNIVSDYREARVVKYISKPLATVLIISLALATQPIDRMYQVLIVVGLVFSLAGDVFLMLPEQPRSYFIPGLIAFLIAQVCYIVAFSTQAAWAPSQVPVLLPFALFGLGTGAYLWRHLGPMKVPVACYMVVILTMGWRAAARIPGDDRLLTSAVLATIGAVVFIISDATLAISRFARPFRASQAIVLGTYFAAQTLIALSVHA